MSPPAALLSLVAAQARGSIQEVPNAMAPHTIFIVVIVVAFLVWAASFSAHTLGERTRQKRRQVLSGRRDSILDSITAVELAREAGTIEADSYKRRMRDLRGELARTLGQLAAEREDNPVGKQTAKRKKKKHA